MGIDVGTSGLKACILDENARQAARTRAAYRSFALHEGWAEIDPDSLWNAMLKAIRDLRDSGIDLSRVAGIGLSDSPVVGTVSCAVSAFPALASMLALSG